jgi:hypothetical protein
MNKLLVLTFLAASGLSAFGESTTQRQAPAPAPSTASQDLFWIADTRKMDDFLAKIDLAQIRTGAYKSETLPDTRSVWRDYAREAKFFAAHADAAVARNRIGQMLKLAAVYRAFGGLQNVVQGEEIRALAGQIADEISVGGIDSPYLEDTLEECLAQVAQQIGADRGTARTFFMEHLMTSVRDSYSLLAGQSGTVTTAAPTGRKYSAPKRR